jgi:hypothetical protein
MLLNVLRLLRVRLFTRPFGYRLEDWLFDHVRDNYRLHIPVIIGALVTSRSPEYSRLMLGVLLRLPPAELEGHEHLQKLFKTEYLHATSVSDALHVCRSALRLCFRA